jgi:hypothetical protein
MVIGIDISQLAYEKTGVANYLQNLVMQLLKRDKENTYVLFYSSLRKKLHVSLFDTSANSRVILKQFRFPPRLLSFIWNTLHIVPIEALIGDVDVFITSDWTEPPTKKAKKATILYDLIIYKYPEETATIIVETQKRKLAWVKKESAMIICISEATKRDAREILGIEEERLAVVYPGTFF